MYVCARACARIPALSIKMATLGSREASSSTTEDETSTSESGHGSRSSNRKKSDVWAFFNKKGTDLVTCKLCSKDYAYRGGTSNLREHLLRIHPSDFKALTKEKPPLRQSTVDGFVCRAKCSNARAKQITELIANMVARDIRPAAIVEGEGFKALLKFIEPGYQVPTSTHISKILQQKHQLGKRVLKEKIQSDADVGLALTTDIWSSCANDAYLSLTGHFLTEQWESISCILSTCPFPGQHTAVNIVEKIKEILETYSIKIDKVVGIVHDQGSNMRLTCEMLESTSSCDSISCAAHKLQLCIEEGLSINIISGAIAAARRLVGHFRHSPLATNELRKRQESMGSPVMKLQQDCPTRWNSQYYMVKSLLECRWPVIAVLADETVTRRQYRYLDLSSENWLILEDLKKILQPFEIATVILSKETNVSLSTVLPIVHGLKKKMTIVEEDSPVVKQFKTKIVEAMAKRWDLQNLEPTQVSVLATALDPRFRQLSFLSIEQKEELKTAILQQPIHNENEDSEMDAPRQKKVKTALDYLLGEEESTSDNSQGIETQISQYFTEKPTPREGSGMVEDKCCSFS